MVYLLLILLVFPVLLWGATYTVSTNADSGAGSLRQAIIDLNTSVDASNTININSALGTISLSSSLPAVNRNVQINGPAVSQALQANNHQVFFVNSGLTTTISNIDITGSKVTGGLGGTGAGGGGGGLGAGGGLFVSSASNVAISNITFASCNATGGAGGAGGASTGGGGGGGFVSGLSGNGNNGGAGGNLAGGGGGGRGGNVLGVGGAGGASGGGSAAAGQNGTNGGVLDGGPGGMGGGGDTYGGGGGGGQGGNGLGLGSNGGNGGNGAVGGFGAGGGGGAGGGTGVLTTGAPGTGSAGGFNGGTGGNGSGTGTGGGGGGAALGGAIFVNGSGILIITTPSSSLFAANTVTAGLGGAGSGAGSAGSAGGVAGLDLFLTSGGSCTFNVPSGTATLSNPIASNQSGGGGGIIKTGSGTLDFATNTLSNTYSGGTAINDGILLINSTNNLGVAADGITMQTGVGVAPTLSVASAVSIARSTTLSGTQTATFAIQSGASLTHSGTIGLSTANLTVDAAASTSSTLSGVVSGSGGSLTKSGAGTLTLSNTGNIYSGGTTVNTGTLIISSDGQLGDTSGQLALSGGTLQTNTTFSSARSISLTSTSAINTNGNDLTLSGVASGTGSLTKTGAGTLFYTGTSGNTYSGLTTVSVGSLTLNKTAGINAVAGDILINGGVVNLSIANQIANTSAMTLSSGTFNMSGNAETLGSLTFQGGTLSQGGAALTLAGAGTALTMRDTTISGNVALTGGGSVVFDSTNNGTATISGNLDLGGSTTTFNIADGSAATDMSLSGIVSNGGITKTSAGRLEFTGASANTFIGVTTVTAGELFLNKTAGINAISGDVLINGGTLTLNAATQIANTSVVTLSSGTFNMAGNAETMANLSFQAGTLTQGGATLTLAGAGTALTMRNTTISGNVALTGGGSVVFDSTNNGTATISGNLDLGGSTTTFNIADGSAATDMSLSGTISNGAIVKTGTGTLELSGMNTYIGGTFINNGLLIVSLDHHLGDPASDLTLGTATLQTQGSFSSLRSVNILGTSVIDTNSNSLTLEGPITGGGSLFKTGTGTLTLRGPNNYSGDTTITEGTLIGDTTGLQGNIFNQASLIFDQPIAGTYAGILSGGGSLTKINTGILTLTGANTYSGGTTVFAGALQGNTTSLQGDILNQATVIFDQATTDTFPGIITGSGSVVKQSGGTLIFSAENNYSGGTTVSAGALKGNTQSLQGDILNQASLVFQQDNPGTYAGILTGAGTLIKDGTSSLTLTGSVTQALTLINLGQLNVLSTLTSAIVVAPSATLRGTGTIVGDVTNHGTVAPGNSIGTWNIIGNYIQAAGSILKIEINPTTSDLLQVTGNVTIQPGTTLVLVSEPGMYKQGTVYTFLTAGGGVGVSGQFSNIVTPFTCISGSSSLIYSINQIQLILCVAPFGELVTKGNAGVVASILDEISDPSPDLQGILGKLQLLPLEELYDVLNQMQPSQFKALTVFQQNVMTLASSSISQHLQGNYVPCKNVNKKRAQFWIAPLFDQARQKKIDDEFGWKGKTKMILAGSDYKWGNSFYTGVAFGFAANQIHWNEVKSKGRVQSYLGNLYGSWVSRWIYINTILSAGSNYLSATRPIQFPNFHRTARHHQSAPFVGAETEIGAFLTYSQVQLRPFGNVAYMHISEKSFSEKGANSLNLEVKGSNAQFLRSELGFNLSGCFTGWNRRWIPEVKGGWVREYRFDDKSITARFKGTEPYFTVNGFYPSRNLLSLGGALTLEKLPNLMSVSLFYSSQMAHRYFNQSFSLLINCPF